MEELKKFAIGLLHEGLEDRKDFKKAYDKITKCQTKEDILEVLEEYLDIDSDSSDSSYYEEEEEEENNNSY